MVKVEPDGRDKLGELRRLEEDAHFRPVSKPGRDDYGDEAYAKLLDYNRGVSDDIHAQRREQEQAGAGEKSKYAPEGAPTTFRAKLKGLPKALFDKKISVKTWLLMGGVSAGAGALIIFMVLLSLFEVPGLAAGISSYEFASLTRQFSNMVDLTTQESMAVASASDGTLGEAPPSEPGETSEVWQNLRATYNNNAIDPVTKKPGLVSRTWDKINSLRPSKIIENMNGGIDQGGHGLKIITKRSGLGREVLQAVELDGKTYPVEQVTGAKGWVPILRDIEVARNNGAFWQNFKEDFYKAMDMGTPDNLLGDLVRSRTAGLWRQQAGIGLTGWDLTKFTAKGAPSPDVVNVQETESKVNQAGSIADNTSTEQLSQAVKSAEEVAQEVESNPAEVAKALANNGVSDEVVRAVAKGVGAKWANNVLSVTDPLLGIALPICIIYDGSVIRSQPTTDNNTRRQEAMFYDFHAKGDELKTGGAIPGGIAKNNGLMIANQATVKQIGPTSAFIPYMAAFGGSGGIGGQISAESGAGGSDYYDIFSALNIDSNSPEGKAVNYILGQTSNNSQNFCSVLTNTGVAIVISAANVTAAIISLGSSQVAENTAGETAAFSLRVATQKIIEGMLGPKIIEESAGKTVERTVVNRLAAFAFTTVPKFAVKQGAIIGGLSLLGFGANEFTRMMVANRMGEFTSGMSQGADYMANVDSGANLVKNEIQRNNFGRAELPTEVTASDNADTQYLAMQNSSQSLATRYLAFSNPNSLTSRVTFAMASIIQPGFFSSLSSLGTTFLDPLAHIGSLLNLVGIAHADPDPSTIHYGNVQFGWTPDEEKLINSNDSYLPLQNQLILDKSHEEDEIAQRYARCFEYDYNSNGDGNLDPTDPNGNLQLNVNGNGSIGNLLANKDIARDDKGNIINNTDSICSPEYLGTSNPNYGDLVFRWRLAMYYDITMNTLISLQTVTN